MLFLQLLVSERSQQPAAPMHALRTVLLQRCCVRAWNQSPALRLRHLRARSDALAAIQAGQSIACLLAQLLQRAARCLRRV